MLKDLNEDQHALAQLMSRISEAGFSANWMSGLEFDLWMAANGGNRQYGRHIITEAEIHQLNVFANRCGCWILFDDQQEETAVDLQTWKQMITDKL